MTQVQMWIWASVHKTNRVLPFSLKTAQGGGLREMTEQAGIDFAKVSSEIINREHEGMSVEDYLREFVGNVLRQLAQDECSFCRKGEVVYRRPHKGLYAHWRRDGALAWVPCRAALIWKRIAEVAR